MTNYTLKFMVGTPADSFAVFTTSFDATDDKDADSTRKRIESIADFEYDFNLLCQTEYLNKQGLA